MNEKSLIYSLFSKFLDEGQEETPRQEDGSESPEREQDRVSGPQGQPYDSTDQTERRDRDQDHRVETVEDWNETEQRRRQQMERELLEEESPETGREDAGQYDEDQSGFSDAQDGSMEEDEADRDARVELLVSDDRMSVSMMVYGPSGGGLDITEEMIYGALEQKGICFGIDRKKISGVAGEKQYLQMVIIAGGQPARNGEDGRIKDYFPRKAQIKYASKGNGGIDFKRRGMWSAILPFPPNRRTAWMCTDSLYTAKREPCPLFPREKTLCTPKKGTGCWLAARAT